MLIKYLPKVEHLKCVILTPKEGLKLNRSLVQLIPGTNEVTDDEWKAMRGNIQAELDSGEIKLLAQKLENGAKAKNLKEMSVANAVRYVNECNSPDTLKKWYNEITKEEVRLAITKKMQKLGIDPQDDDEIPADDDSDAGASFDDDEEEDKKAVSGKDSDGDDEVTDDLEADLATKTNEELKTICEEKGIDTKKLKTKSELIDAILSIKE